jgi:hypothetical protein
MIREVERAAGTREQRAEPGLALQIGEAGQVLAILFEEVEGEEGERGAALLQGRLQRLEARAGPRGLVRRSRRRSARCPGSPPPAAATMPAKRSDQSRPLRV